MRLLFLLPFLFMGRPVSCSETDDLRELVGLLVEQNAQLTAAAEGLRTGLLSQLQQKHDALVASATAQSHQEARWRSETVEKLQYLADRRGLTSAVSNQRRRGLSSDTCADPSGPALLVEGVCSCTEGLLVEGRNVTKELDTLSETVIPTTTQCSLVNVSTAQEIDTQGAYDWEYFTIGDTHYLAVANFYSGTSFQIKSVIYRYNNATGDFYVAQSINTTGARDWEHFSIDNQHYLAVANHYPYQSRSVIYHYNNTTGDFDVAQSIDTEGAADWEHFTIGKTHYLAVANQFSGTTRLVESVIYRYNNATGEFDVAQRIDTEDARDWEHFTIDNTHYLAVANHHDDISVAIESVIYRYNNATGEFDVAQNIDTLGAMGWEHFTIGNAHYLAVANYWGDSVGSTREAKSVIYRFNNTTGEFDVAQSVDTLGATDWEHFSIGNVHYLVAANNDDDTTTQIQSVIYRYNDTMGDFDAVQSIGTVGAVDLEHFAIGNTHYLAAANNRLNTTSFQIKSVIFRVAVAC